MLRTDVAESLRDEFGEDGRLFPDYEGYCFANVPATLGRVLGADDGWNAESETNSSRTLPEDVLAGVDLDGIENVLLVLVDGFGFEQWRRQREHHLFLDHLSDRARVTPLTSIYPSETAAAMTTFHTGALPAEHGVIGWNVYEPTADVSFEALPFQTKDGEEPPISRSAVADAESRYRGWADAGVDSHFVTPFSSFDDSVTDHSYETLDELAEAIPEVVTEAEDPSYCFAYVPSVDATSHESGTESQNYRETVGEVFDAVEEAVAGLDAEVRDETLVVVTADHGHVNTDPERNVNLDGYDWLLDALQRHGDGTPVRFSGSPRNVHLHLRDDDASGDHPVGDESRVQAVAHRLRAQLDALAFTQQEALDRDLFGDVPSSETFRRRLGDVVLTHRDLGTWYGDEEPDELELVGMHGGLHPEEMLVPFAAVRADELAE